MFNKKEKLILGIFSFLFLLVLGSLISNNSYYPGDSKEISYIIVHVAGDVRNPGVYKLGEEARVIDAINLAGGPLSSADLDRLNLADFLKDGDKIQVPSKNIPSFQNSPSSKVQVPLANTENSERININLASKAELETLPGIGPILAERIIQYREENGNFSSLSDLLEVKGIGEKKIEKIKDKITW
ncbi:MAG TPA: ComEA family DNA-binding protein [Dictyoglomaceae bacterium]|nr:ComEA family DNA-binding protein [Dictyoglomaceae bacterium]HOL38716.1 ComEA family DNA-binding protein [Dictyoglomaceae bacterium]HOP94580.1 ComEA family DNA-binding protein [Dictyoglomaceae bacterium]HPP15535.1 ComEA family DNA-binding protein [Dictyoglomaceae bacterium]HPU42850.1 ComEA family DNA-binding protein [Dictyoglomaceae bacterium]